MLQPIGGGSLSQGEQLWLGYVASEQTANLVKTESDIAYSAGATEAEKLLTVPLEKPAGRWDKFLDLLTSFGTNVLGVIVGAGISYWAFRKQQSVIAAQDELKLFRQNKLTRADDIRRFFAGKYKLLRLDEGDDLEHVQAIRAALVKEGIYAILPMAALIELDAICNGSLASADLRPTRLHNLLLANFRETMGDS
jgi:hypothetical protein